MTRTRIEYFAIFVLVYSNVHGRKWHKCGQSLVVCKNAPCILIGARYYDPEVAQFSATDPILEKSPMPTAGMCMPPGARLSMLVGMDMASSIMQDIAASGYDPSVINGWEQKLLSNPYGYCGGDPVNNIDPDGRFSGSHYFSTWWSRCGRLCIRTKAGVQK
jgi:hypothetical protein